MSKIYGKWFKEYKKKGLYDCKIYYLDDNGNTMPLPLEKGKTKSSLALIPSEITGSTTYAEFKGISSPMTVPKGDLHFIIEFPENIMSSLSDDMLEYFVLREVFCPVKMEVKMKTRPIQVSKNGALLGLIGGSQHQSYNDLQPIVERTKDGKVKVTCYHVQPGQYGICPYHVALLPATFKVE